MLSSKPTVSRRRMLASLGVLLVAPRVILAKRPVEKTNLYIDESGNFGSAEPFVLGALLTTNPDRHFKQFSSIRTKNKYRLTLRYGSNDEHKLPYARQLLEYFFAEKDLRFCAYACTSAKNAAWPTDPKIKEITYHDLYGKLLGRCATKNENLSLTLKQRTTTGEDQFLYDYLKKKFIRIDALQVVRAHQNDLMQFADLLTGCIAADKTRPKDQTKQSVLKSLKEKLSFSSLWENSLINHDKFSVALVEN